MHADHARPKPTHKCKAPDSHQQRGVNPRDRQDGGQQREEHEPVQQQIAQVGASKRPRIRRKQTEARTEIIAVAAQVANLFRLGIRPRFAARLREISQSPPACRELHDESRPRASRRCSHRRKRWRDNETFRAIRTAPNPARSRERKSRCESRRQKCKARPAFLPVDERRPKWLATDRPGRRPEAGSIGDGCPCNCANSSASTAGKVSEGFRDSFAMNDAPLSENAKKRIWGKAGLSNANPGKRRRELLLPNPPLISTASKPRFA